MRLRILVLSAAAIALAAPTAGATGPAAPAAPGDALRPGTYRVVLQSPGGELPFRLDLRRIGDAWVGYLVNGPERLKVDEITVRSAHLEIKMPGYENRLSADATAGGFAGELVLDKLGGRDQHIPLRAQLGPTYRFFPPAPADAAEPASVAGRWSVTFTGDDGDTDHAVGEFSQAGREVSGTFLTETGDHRFLAGEVHDGDLFLSTFDGAHVFLYRAKRSGDSLAGDFWSGSAYHERWTARRDPHAVLADAYSLTRMNEGTTSFDFAFPDVSGRMVSSHDPQFQGKVMIVALAGSWCPNCHDEAAFLAPVYRRYRGKGLEIVSLMFEHFGDPERAAAATTRFRERYGIEYTTLIAGISDKDDASKRLPMLNRVVAFPTLIFVDRRGRVRKIHTGFSGPATGSHYTQFADEFQNTLDELLAEPQRDGA